MHFLPLIYPIFTCVDPTWIRIHNTVHFSNIVSARAIMLIVEPVQGINTVAKKKFRLDYQVGHPAGRISGASLFLTVLTYIKVEENFVKSKRTNLFTNCGIWS